MRSGLDGCCEDKVINILTFLFVSEIPCYRIIDLSLESNYKEAEKKY